MKIKLGIWICNIKFSNCLMTYEEDSTKFFACLDTPEIYLFEINKINNEFAINLILTYDHYQDLCAKRLKSLRNNTFHSYSADSFFVVWDTEDIFYISYKTNLMA